ncbi:TIGR02530 family flagellar biosynthesis protein [Chengkuizengella axinellae]|uniref:TIGR02530 family flagellar biosynthesis protein n=1 Tax=Chengkuizengella axinellae TaxID=3064388 RepID=A0ABT9IVQ6_9BACL|nr:TIGR02530 family flagellar biosynthesis protein [Chengkuizengella sp. 2205SS18-9]MDP5273445.1 TIGR02530 family flagellar biosynthesis protein [Chengkuizengella sp. 2205SS18-9]
MDHKMIGHLQTNHFPSTLTNKTQSVTKQKHHQTFEKILQDEMLNISHHAELRLKQRGIQLQPDQIHKLNQAIDRASAKGAQDSLILLNDTAFIVNIKNRTVVTAIDSKSMNDHVFTNIDSALFLT